MCPVYRVQISRLYVVRALRVISMLSYFWLHSKCACVCICLQLDSILCAPVWQRRKEHTKNSKREFFHLSDSN